MATLSPPSHPPSPHPSTVKRRDIASSLPTATLLSLPSWKSSISLSQSGNSPNSSKGSSPANQNTRFASNWDSVSTVSEEPESPLSLTHSDSTASSAKEASTPSYWCSYSTYIRRTARALEKEDMASLVSDNSGSSSSGGDTTSRPLRRTPSTSTRSNTISRTPTMTDGSVSHRLSIHGAGHGHGHSKRLSISSRIFGTNNAKTTATRRWDGNQRRTTEWDCLRRDPELWFPHGDLLVYFYAQGQSRRGPALRLELEDLQAANCHPLLDAHLVDTNVGDDLSDASSGDLSASSEEGGFYTNPRTAGKYELYLPAPETFTRDEAHDYHLATRNFFAWVYEKPLVGPSLGDSLIAVRKRMDEYRPSPLDNSTDLTAYIEDQGYADFVRCPDHALAVLRYAEDIQDADLWIDAFAHCVGMYTNLDSSKDYAVLTPLSRALITRAHLEMIVRLERASLSLGNLLEAECASAFAELPEQARKHLDRFRSFLQTFYVQRHGYWPPNSTHVQRSGKSILHKNVIASMYVDFRNLYNFIADTRSVPDAHPANNDIYNAIYGGLCTPALIESFDRRYKYAALPHSVPLLPTSPAKNASPYTSTSDIGRAYDAHSMGESEGFNYISPTAPTRPSLLSRLVSSKKSKANKDEQTLSSLSAATNTHVAGVMDSEIVHEFARFEREWTLRHEEKLDVVEARKVRWLVVYGILQVLISVTRAPTEVRVTEGVDYPLCCLTGGTPPWKADSVSSRTASEVESISSNSLRAQHAQHETVPAIPELSRRRMRPTDPLLEMSLAISAIESKLATLSPADVSPISPSSSPDAAAAPSIPKQTPTPSGAAALNYKRSISRLFSANNPYASSKASQSMPALVAPSVHSSASAASVESPVPQLSAGHSEAGSHDIESMNDTFEARLVSAAHAPAPFLRQKPSFSASSIYSRAVDEPKLTRGLDEIVAMRNGVSATPSVVGLKPAPLDLEGVNEKRNAEMGRYGVAMVLSDDEFDRAGYDFDEYEGEDGVAGGLGSYGVVHAN